MLGELEPTSGKIDVGEKTEFNYVDQSRLLLNDSDTVIDAIGEGRQAEPRAGETRDRVVDDGAVVADRLEGLRVEHQKREHWHTKDQPADEEDSK